MCPTRVTDKLMLVNINSLSATPEPVRPPAVSGSRQMRLERVLTAPIVAWPFQDTGLLGVGLHSSQSTARDKT